MNHCFLLGSARFFSICLYSFGFIGQYSLQFSVLNPKGIFATEWALAALWRSWGIEPVALIGHSLGEYAAACMAGVVSLEDALRLVVLRGALVDRLSGGAMLSVPLPEAELRELIRDDLDLAAVNGPALCVVSGRRDRIEALAARLTAREIECRLVPVDAAGHSRELA